MDQILTNTSLHDIDQRTPLLRQRIHHRRPRRRQRSLEHVAQDTEDRVESLEVFGVVVVFAPLDAREELRDEDQVDDQGGGEEGVFADVEKGDGLVAGLRSLSISDIHDGVI